MFNGHILGILRSNGRFKNRGLFLKTSITVSPLILAIYVCFTRIKDNRHFLIDVMVGQLIGLICGLYYTYMLLPSLLIIKSHSNSDDELDIQW